MWRRSGGGLVVLRSERKFARSGGSSEVCRRSGGSLEDPVGPLWTPEG